MFALLIACSTGFGQGGQDPDAEVVPDLTLTEAQVENFVTNGPIDLAGLSTMDGDRLLTEIDLQWEGLESIPESLLDGDDDLLSTLSCIDGDWIQVDQGSWTCTGVVPVDTLDVGDEGDVLSVRGGVATWTAVTEALSGTCPSGMVTSGDSCIDEYERTAQGFVAAVVDCADDGYHLCSLLERIPACEAESLNDPQNAEWLSDASNRAVTKYGAPGFPEGCATVVTASINESDSPYRCCVHP